MHFLQCAIAALIVIASGLLLMARYSVKKDPTEEAKVIQLDEHESKIGGDYPPLKKAQNN